MTYIKLYTSAQPSNIVTYIYFLWIRISGKTVESNCKDLHHMLNVTSSTSKLVILLSFIYIFIINDQVSKVSFTTQITF